MASKSESEFLTRDECLEIIKNNLELKDTSEINLLTFKTEKCATDLVGFMGEYYKLQVEAIVKASQDIFRSSYFVKSLPISNQPYRDECERKGFLKKEANIYSNILPNIQKYARKPLFPKAFYTRSDILVLEDFSLPQKRLSQMAAHESYTVQHYQLFLKHLAQLHAASLAWECEEKINIGQQFESTLYEIHLTTKNEWYTTGIKALIYLALHHPEYQYEQALGFINNKLYNILLKMEDFTKPSQTLHNVLCHRDAWNANIFWELNESHEPVACRIVDFQLTTYSPPAIDVLYFLYNNFKTSEEKSKLLKELLQYYYQSLRNSIKELNLPADLITQEEFDEDCQRALLPVLTLRAICEPLLVLPSGWSQMIRESEPETFDRYMNAERTEMFTRVSKFDSTYMNKILLPVQELLEYFGFKPK